MNHIRLAFFGIALIGTLVFAPNTFAHSSPEKARAFYGGIAQETAQYNLEVVVEDGKLSLFVRDRHNWPTFIPESKAKAQLLGDQVALELTLLPGEKNALTAAGDFLKAHSRRAIVTLWTYPGAEPVHAEFNLKPAND